ncbi:pirin family protein [Microbulbifer agarilyticus]|uniref:pirin family protein n=1 Tax=Microbulbifer agarilyticus TaxID=260552 RepID=UPI001C9610CF|nr:pirin family protein [Microbulbifer agarilyticus]MBY6189933.1 pirin family protein [Microbulbifer agarilyticus]
MQTLKFEDLPQGGFAGLKERQFVTDRRVFPRASAQAFDGVGNFVYLADANFQPFGETGLHPHREIDVISVMVDGRISHAGSLEHGQGLEAGYTQVQRAGAEGFSHNEINPDGKENHMIQLWVLPDQAGERAGYKVYEPKVGQVQTVYGGPMGQDETFYSGTSIAVANLEAGQQVEHNGDVLAFLSKGEGKVNGTRVSARTAIRSKSGIALTALEDAQLILVYVN